jgi:acyl-CoA thioesterase-2
MPDTLDGLLALLDIEEIDVDIFRAPNPGDRDRDRLFGGQVAAQALRAAVATVDPERHVHSLHAYFLRPGLPGSPILLQVDRIRDGRSFTTRRVVAVQRGEAIFSMGASFHRSEAGDEYRVPMPAGVPGPDDAPPADAVPSRFRSRFPFETREFPPPPPAEDGSYPWTRRAWVRTKGRLPDDPVVHACVLTFMSDMRMVSAARVPIGRGSDRFMGASLDHAVWFHRPVRPDEWVFVDARAVSVSGARGMSQATMHTGDGVLAVSVAQESLLRSGR